MNDSSLSIWLHGYGSFAVEVGCIIVLASVLNALCKGAAVRRGVWQVCFISLFLLVLMEVTAVGPRVTQFIGRSLHRSGVNLTDMAMQESISGGTKAVPNLESLPAPVDSAEESWEELSTLASMPDVTPEFEKNSDQTLLAPHPAAGVRAESSKELLGKLDATVLAFNAIWLIGVCVLLGRIAFTRMLALRLRARSVLLDRDHPLCARVRELSSHLGLRRQVALVECTRTSSPLVLGFYKPVIGLPPGFTSEFSPPQQEAMLLHELSHIAGRDFIWFLLAEVMQAALWWHPLVWWARRQLAHAAETAADDASLLVANGPGVLAECLVEFGRRLERPSVLGRLGVAGFRSGLGRRVSRLLSLREHQWKPLSRARALWIKVLSTTALVVAPFGVTYVTFPQTLNLGETPMHTIHKSWKHSAAVLLLLANLAPANPADAPAPNVPLPVHADPIAPVHAVRGHIAHNTGSFPAPNIPDSPERRAILNKLDSIVLEQLFWDGLPLSEVLKMLNQEAIKRDPEKLGVNFIVARTPSQRSGMVVDPRTGLPPAPAEEVDLNSILIKTELPLKKLRLKDVLEIMTKVAERPIRFSVEPYGVVLSSADAEPESPGIPAPGTVRHMGQNAFPVPATHSSTALQVRTYRIDTNQFLANIETTFNVKVNGGSMREQILKSLESVFDHLDVHLVPNKNLFFNDRLNVLMIRTEAQAVEIVDGVIETLGGTRAQATPRPTVPKTY